MEMIVVLIVGVPLALTVWLIVRAISAKHRIEELARRVGMVQKFVHRQNTGGSGGSLTPAATQEFFNRRERRDFFFALFAFSAVKFSPPLWHRFN